MQTADWAFVISICSAATALLGLAWNVWSKFINPKPKLWVRFTKATVLGSVRDDDLEILSLTATNMGPIPVTLHAAQTKLHRSWFRPREYGLLMPLHNYPLDLEFTLGPFSGGLPKKLDVGSVFTSYFIVNHENLAKDNYSRIGFSDTFGRNHWAPIRDVGRTRPKIKEAVELSGKEVI